MTNAQGTSAVRLQINIPNLEQYLSIKIPNFKPPLEVRQFKFGQSNPTYLLIDANKSRYVLRKKPPGTLLSNTAHAVEREFRILDALSRNTDVPVPKVYLLCEDNSILGTPFYVMEFLEGRIFEDVQLPSLSSEDRYKCWYAAVDALAKLHSIDYKAIGLENYGKHSGYYSRQIKSLVKVSNIQAAVKDESGKEVGPLPRLDDMIKWFEKNEVDDETTIVHGDFKLDNLVFHSTKPEVIGILDWELSTIGNPLSDLANLLINFHVKDQGIEPLKGLSDVPNLQIPSADELIRFYCNKVKRSYPIPKFEFCIVFSCFRLAVITQGIAARIARNQASSAQAKIYAKLFVPLTLHGLKIIDESGDLQTKSKL